MYITNLVLKSYFWFKFSSVKEVIDGTPPFIREKPRDVALAEGKSWNWSLIYSNHL